MASGQAIKFHIVFMDESEAEWVSSSTDFRAAKAEFLASQWLNIDGINYNKAFVFSWEQKNAEK